MPVSKSRTRRLRKRSRRLSRRRKQRGGAVLSFQVFVFTKPETPLTDAEKAQIIDVLQALYGPDVVEYTGSENNIRSIGKILITDFVHEKRGHYPALKNVTTFTIPTIPAALLEGAMNDNKLTFEEYKIRDELARRGIPFKLVRAQHGLWTEELALIALERT